MVRSTITFQSLRNCESSVNVNYWSMLHGEFPWCLDESEQTDEPSELIGIFDLVIAEPAMPTRSATTRVRSSQDRFHPDTNWLVYAEAFMREHASLLIFSPLESIGAYANAITNAGLSYQTSYIWQNNAKTSPAEAIIWASKEQPNSNCQPFKSQLLLPPTQLQSLEDQRQWLLETLIEAFSQAEMNLLEPFMTNGQILLACQKLRRYALAVARRRSYIKQAEQILLGNLKRTA
jgi:hypothetical protein